MRRRKPLKSSPLAPKKGRRKSEEAPKEAKKARREKRIRPRNPDRQTREWKRAYGSIERVRAIKEMPCYACGERLSENAHLGNGGMGRKSDWTQVVNLCAWCHRLGSNSLHQLGIDAFDREHDTALRRRARQLATELRAEHLPPDAPELRGLEL